MSALLNLTKIIDESLALIGKSKPATSPAMLEQNEVPSLLEQCLELSKHHKEQVIESIHIVYHYGLPTDSPLFSAFEQLTNTKVLTDIDSIDELKKIQREYYLIGQKVLLCLDIISSELISQINKQFDDGDIKALIIAYNPVDSYSIYCDGFDNNVPTLDFEDYCQKALEFIGDNDKLEIIKNEDFLKEPDETMEQICNKLKLPNYLKHFNNAPRPHHIKQDRPDLKNIHSLINYTELTIKLNYDTVNISEQQTDNNKIKELNTTIKQLQEENNNKTLTIEKLTKQLQEQEENLEKISAQFYKNEDNLKLLEIQFDELLADHVATDYELQEIKKIHSHESEVESHESEEKKS